MGFFYAIHLLFHDGQYLQEIWVMLEIKLLTLMYIKIAVRIAKNKTEFQDKGGPIMLRREQTYSLDPNLL